MDIPLNDAGDDGHWICISPPGTPRGPTENHEDLSTDDVVRGLERLEPEAPEACEELAGLFEGIWEIKSLVLVDLKN